MKKSILKRLVSGAVSAFLTMTAVMPAAGSAANPDYQETFKKDGYDYELWNQYSQGTTRFDAGSNGTYSCQWSGIHNVLFRAGKKWNDNPRWDSLDGIAVDYACEYNPSGNSYLCIYGWTVDPLVEYYICDTYGSWRPPGDGFQKMGLIKVDGGTYEVYSGEHDGPSIDPNVNHFKQYWSVRVDSDLRSEGTITVSDHFKAWEQYNMKMGGLHEVALNVEGWESSGTANVTKNALRIGDGSGGDDPTIIDDKPGEVTAQPDENGCYFTSSFDSGKDKWTSRGETVLSNDTKNYYDGGSSLYVSGRTEDWNGAALSLPTDAFVAGNTYSISLAALQKSGSVQPMKLTLEYTDASGKKNYSTVAEADVNSGEWTKIENKSYTIPTGASGLLLYAEATDPTIDFWIDSAIGAVEGTASSVVTGSGTVEGKTSQVTEKPTEAPTQAPTEQPTTVTPVTNRVWGDANLDNNVSISDAVSILQYMANGEKYPLEGEALINADVYKHGDGITGNDAGSIQKYDAGAISSLPESYKDGVKPEDTPSPSTPSTTVPDTQDVSGEGKIYSISFDNAADIEAQGDVVIALDKDNYYSDGSSAKVSGRSDSWQGVAKTLGNDFSAGKSYSFSAAVMQASGSPVGFALTLQYNDETGKAHYDNITSATAKSGEWTKIENASFKIPAGASDMKVYVETPESKTDYYVDDLVLAHDGTKSSVVTGKGVVTAKAPEKPAAKDGVDISWIDPSKPMVAISFDDGAKGTDPGSPSMRIINAIADAGFHSTFFYVGDWTNDSNKGEVQYAYSKGMEIANHSTTHPKLTEKSESEIRSEFDTTHAKLKSIIGAEPSKMMRLPYLNCDSKVQSVLNDVALITCKIDTGDWNKASTQDIISKITNAMNDGSLKNSIVLCHETYDTTAEAMEYLAPYLKSQGWQIVTISEMFAVNGKELKGGTVYTSCN
ncbi:MAG: glycoside hydrolase family 11 protein [Ruminococcus sp.]|nr:glycoside hydrolase family 11 protein [Ruminococcus sp.]